MTAGDCQCNVPHAANLRMKPLVSGQWENRFEIVFSYGTDDENDDVRPNGWAWQKATVTSEGASADRVGPGDISSLCRALNNPQRVNLLQTPLGYLPFPDTIISRQKFLVQITASGEEGGARKAISVDEFLKTLLGSEHFGTRDKLEFALALASSMPWLHSSPWMKTPWTSKDILLLQNQGTIDRHSFREPYVKYLFKETPTISLEPDASLLDSSMFTLGVIFLQVVEDAPLEDLYRTYVSATDARLSREEMAHKVELVVRKRIMSPTWRNLIRRCIYGIIDERNPTADLDYDHYLQLFYIKIILPLSEALAVVSGRQKTEIAANDICQNRINSGIIGDW